MEIERELHCCVRITEAKGELPNDIEDHEGGVGDGNCLMKGGLRSGGDMMKISSFPCFFDSCSGYLVL